MILVGEIRDVETARIAVQSALTGHLVLSSLHATDAVSALYRFLDMGIESFLVASSVLGVVGQRLVRRICDVLPGAVRADRRGARASTSEAGGRAEDQFWAGDGLQLLRATPATPAASASTRCCRSPTRCATLIVEPHPSHDEMRALAIEAGHARRCASEAMRAGRAGRDHHRRSRPHHLHASEDDGCRSTPGRRRRRARAPSLTGVELARLDRPRRRVALLDRRRRRPRGHEKRSWTQIEITKAKVKRAELMHFSRQLAAFVRAGIPILDAIAAHRRGGRQPRRSSSVMARRSTRTCGPACRSRTPSDQHPEVFPAYYRGILRSAELTGQLDTVLDQLSHYIERDLEATPQDQVRAHLPGRHRRRCRSSPSSCSASSCCRSSRTSSEPRRRAAAADPRCCWASRDFLGTWWWALAAGLLAVVLTAALVVPHDQRPAAARPPAPAPAGRRRHRALRDHRALLPDHRLDDHGRRAAARGDAGRRPSSLNNRVFQDALAQAREAMLEGEGLAAPIGRTGAVPRRRDADDPGGRGDRHARPAARGRRRRSTSASSTTSSSGSPRCSSRPSSSSWA